MRASDLLRLLALAAIWGGSFVLLRIVAPTVAPVMIADVRVLFAGVALIVFFLATGFDVEWARYWKQYLIIGTVNSAIPFSLYGFAAQHIPASYSAVLNSASPLFGLLFGAIWLGEKLTPRKLVAMLLGALGVAFVARPGGAPPSEHFFAGALACLGAGMCYALAGVYVKKRAQGAKPRAIAGASQLMAGLVLLPVAAAGPMPGALSTTVVLSLLALSFLCSGVAYLLYFRLISDLGPARALTVTFLMPLFGMLWAALFLGESVGASTAAGCTLILAGTFLALRP